MISKVKLSTIYECSLERAFKTPTICVNSNRGCEIIIKN